MRSLSPLTLTYTSPSVLFRESSSSAAAVTHRIPGFKTSASFLHSLRANIHLATSTEPFSPSPSSSTTHLPIFPSTNPDSLHCTGDGLCLPNPYSPASSPDRSSLSPLPPPSSLPTPPSLALEINSPANVPSPVTYIATTDDDEIAALKLTANSVVEQRRLTATSLIFHPILLAFYVAILAILTNLFYKGRSGDLAIVLTADAVVTMAGLFGIRLAVGGYLVRAEEVGTWSWLDAGKDIDGGGAEEDEVLVTRLGDEIIGTLVIRGIRDSGPSGGSWGRNHAKKRQRSISSNAAVNGRTKAKGLIRAWTVKQEYRRQGVGGALLEEAVEWCRNRGWSGPVFADDHANSVRVLPAMFDGGFEQRESRARRMLEAYVEGTAPVAVVGDVKRAKARR